MGERDRGPTGWEEKKKKRVGRKLDRGKILRLVKRRKEEVSFPVSDN